MPKLTNAERFEQVKDEYLAQYKRTTGRDYPEELQYKNGWVIFAYGNYRLQQFLDALETLKLRPDHNG